MIDNEDFVLAIRDIVEELKGINENLKLLTAGIDDVRISLDCNGRANRNNRD